MFCYDILVIWTHNMSVHGLIHFLQESNHGEELAQPLAVFVGYCRAQVIANIRERLRDNGLLYVTTACRLC